jgi:hypothetical protein
MNKEVDWDYAWTRSKWSHLHEVETAKLEIHAKCWCRLKLFNANLFEC